MRLIGSVPYLLVSLFLFPVSSLFSSSAEYPITGTSFSFEGTEQSWFSGLVWPAAEASKAVVVSIHGLSGAAEDFEPLGSYFSKQGVTVVSYNLRGMGKDPREARRGDIRDSAHWLEDLDRLFDWVEAQYPDTPIILLGESLGALIGLEWVASEPFRQDRVTGLILSSPVVELVGELPWWQDWMARFFLWVAPGKKLDLAKLGEDSESSETRVTRDDAYHQYLETAPHRVESFSLRMLKGIVTLVEGASEALARMEKPLLILYAEHDIFVKPKAIRAFVEKQNHPSPEMAYFPEAYHLLFHDPDTPEVLARVHAWLKQQVN